MDSAYTIVVPDADVLSCVCGTNDSNLKLIEEHLGVPVFTRGNELSVDEEDPVIREKFRFIIDRIIDEIESGDEDGKNIIASVLNTKTSLDISHSAISIPGGFRKIYPRSDNQARYIDMLRSFDMVICTGAAGSGKTFLAVAEALKMLLSHNTSKLVVTRPVVEAGESLGYLPGDLEQKLNPYLRPFYDAMESLVPRETVRRLVESGAVETAPLAYMRGRTLEASVVILDEAQNTTREQMKMFLTRMGENVKVFVTGDITQIDLPRRTESGLVHALGLLKSIPDIGTMKLTADDVIRAPLVRKIVKAYEDEERQ
ncbi:PhoH family protein [Treponema socranskii]|uniref:PhoH family protein n=1 Tax=Treponema socranskii TaxID=53419 RepID=UPI003D6ED6F6